ncbi:MAG: hypothetical protein HC925_08330 [Coleofasciculaceae cyanobacterium SM2_3_26]|nr:hypothetical protein [Coleofasciculaceae cyanobacterium SM2_3_26]
MKQLTPASFSKPQTTVISQSVSSTKNIMNDTDRQTIQAYHAALESLGAAPHLQPDIEAIAQKLANGDDCTMQCIRRLILKDDRLAGEYRRQRQQLQRR